MIGTARCAGDRKDTGKRRFSSCTRYSAVRGTRLRKEPAWNVGVVCSAWFIVYLRGKLLVYKPRKAGMLTDASMSR